MTAPDLSIVASLATAAAVLVALAFGAIQLRSESQRRRGSAALSQVQGFRHQEFADALRRVLCVPDAVEPQKFEVRTSHIGVGGGQVERRLFW